MFCTSFNFLIFLMISLSKLKLLLYIAARLTRWPVNSTSPNSLRSIRSTRCQHWTTMVKFYGTVMLSARTLPLSMVMQISRYVQTTISCVQKWTSGCTSTVAHFFRATIVASFPCSRAQKLNTKLKIFRPYLSRWTSWKPSWRTMTFWWAIA